MGLNALLIVFAIEMLLQAHRCFNEDKNDDDDDDGRDDNEEDKDED